MLNNILNNDIKVPGYVLRRTNYGEADRILNIITPRGKISAIAKGARKEKSKLAGSIEMFTLTDFNVHFGKSELGIVTSVRMKKYYSEIVKDLGKMDLAVTILKKISNVAEGSDSPEYFKIVDQSLIAINEGENLAVVEAWYLLKMKKTMGEEINLYRDANGEKLAAEKKYSWDVGEMSFLEDIRGEYGANEIKMLRLMSSNDLNVVRRVKVDHDILQRALRLIKIVI